MMPAGGSSYRSFMAPGLLAMTLLFGAMLAALSLVHDRESGVLRMLLIAPIHHAWIVLARIASATAVALMQGILLLLMLAAAGYARASWDFALLAFALIMTAWAAASHAAAVQATPLTLATSCAGFQQPAQRMERAGQPHGDLKDGRAKLRLCRI